MFFITAIDFWIHRLEEHMQKIISEHFGIPFEAKSSKTKITAEWLILDLFKIPTDSIPLPETLGLSLSGSPKNSVLLSSSSSGLEAASSAEVSEPVEKIDLSKYKMQYGDTKIQFDLIWKDIINGEHRFLSEKISAFFNPESTSIGLTQFKLLLVFRLQQKCLSLREAAFLRLVERDNLRKEIEAQKALSVSDAAAAASPVEIQSEPEGVIDDLAQKLQRLKMASETFSDEILLSEILEALTQIRGLMQQLEQKSALKINQFTVTPSDGRTGELLHDFDKTIREIFHFFQEVDASSGLHPGQDHALLDCSPKKIFKQNDPLLIVYENAVPYLLSNYTRLANFNRLSQTSGRTGMLLGLTSSLLSFVTQPVKTVSDQFTLWTYDPAVAEQKRRLLLTTILALRKSLHGQPILDERKWPNEGVWENCDRTLSAQAEEALRSQGLSIRSQEFTLFFNRTRENLKESREQLKQKMSAAQAFSPAGMIKK
jgi:hypothetical protein